jgi:hypothetical protein
MAVFMSYARQDRAAVDALRRDIEFAHRETWIDGSLTGGQAWWDTIGRRPEASRQPPAAHDRTPLVPRPEPRAFNAGAFAALVLATVVIPLVGLIVGLVNSGMQRAEVSHWPS